MTSSSSKSNKTKSSSLKKDTSIVLKCLQSTMTSNTALMWCVVVGLILASFTMTQVMADSKGHESIPSSTINEIDMPSSSHAVHHDVPQQQILKELFSSSSTKKSVHEEVQAGGSSKNAKSVRRLDGVSTCTDPQWNQQGLDLDGDAANHKFGYSVALSENGTILIVGSASFSGGVKVFAKKLSSPHGWVQLGDTLYGDAEGDYAGYSVAISATGDVIAFGYTEKNGNNSGYVKVFRLDSSTSWTQIGSNIEGEAEYDQSGYSIALSGDGDVLAIGAPYNDGNGSGSGHVRIYRLNESATGWSQVGKDLDGNAANHWCGSSVDLSLDGTIVAFGCFGGNFLSGYVKIFKEDTSVELGWVQQGYAIVGEATSDNVISVALSGLGDIIAIGFYFVDGYSSSETGYVRVYGSESTSSGSWSQLGIDIDGEATGDYSGSSVAISYSGDIVAIGAHLNDGGGDRSGHTRVYIRDPTSLMGWVQVGNDVDGESSGDRFGRAVALSANGHVLASGAIRNDDNGSRSGHVRVYEIIICKETSESNFYFSHKLVRGVVSSSVAVKKPCTSLNDMKKKKKICEYNGLVEGAWNMCDVTCGTCNN